MIAPTKNSTFFPGVQAGTPLKKGGGSTVLRLGLLWLLVMLLHVPVTAFGQPSPGEDGTYEVYGDGDGEGEEGEDNTFEETMVMLHVRLVGSVEIPAIIHGQVAYLPVKDVFQFLKIKVVPSENLELLEGFFINPKATYVIDKSKNRIQYGDKTFRLDSTGLILTESNLFLRLDYFGKVFGLDCQFSFRSLSVTLNSKVELPVVREMQYERMRQNLTQLKGERRVDTVVRRSFPLFRFGVADWSFIQSKTSSGKADTRLALSLGAMVAGGEATAYLNYSPGQPLNRRQQFYRWRYVDNDRTFVKQVVIGNVGTQTVSSLFGAVTGVQVSNTPTVFRRSFGTYRLSNTTNPGWLVELYVNNVLVAYTRADASGFFTFDVPLVYGNSLVKLRFFGPWGEEESREQSIAIPYNFLPARRLEYTLTAGVVGDGGRSRFSRLNMAYGLHSKVTVGAGVEYLSSLTAGKAIPFVNASVRLTSHLMVTGEHSYGVRSSASLRYQLPSNMQFEVNYTKYVDSQLAIRPGKEAFLNYTDERKAILFIPLRTGNFSAFSRVTFNQIRIGQTYLTNGEVLVSGQVAGINTNLTTSATADGSNKPVVFSNLAMNFRLPRGTRLTPQVRYEYTRKEVNLARVELEKNVFKNGFANVSVGRDFSQQTNNFTLGFRYNFAFAQASSFLARMGKAHAAVQSVRGSLLYNSSSRSLASSNQPAIGRGGLLLVAFLDLNGNGKRDPGEPKAAGLKARVSGGRVVRNVKDTSIQVTGLEAYTPYFIELEKSSFDNIAWSIKKPVIKFTAEPNHFKVVEVPVSILGEVTGVVYKKEEEGQKGLGRIIVAIYNQDSVLVAKTLTEPDGYFSYIGLAPGTYIARIDAQQLAQLDMTAVSGTKSFTIKVSMDGDIVEGLQFILEASPEMR